MILTKIIKFIRIKSYYGHYYLIITLISATGSGQQFKWSCMTSGFFNIRAKSLIQQKLCSKIEKLDTLFLGIFSVIVHLFDVQNCMNLQSNKQTGD